MCFLFVNLKHLSFFFSQIQRGKNQFIYMCVKVIEDKTRHVVLEQGEKFRDLNLNFDFKIDIIIFNLCFRLYVFGFFF